MIPAGKYTCGHCGAKMNLEQSQVQVPIFRRRWWQLSAERSEFKCPACSQFNMLRPTIGGFVLYALLAAAIVAAWLFGISRAAIGMASLVVAALLFRHSVMLKAAR